MSDCLKWIFGDSHKNDSKSIKGKELSESQFYERTPPIISTKRVSKLPEDLIIKTHFVSPNGVNDKHIDAHTIRLKERGYEIKSMLGKGTFGKCYEVTNLTDGTKKAVKIMFIREFYQDDRLYKDFANEVWILSKVPHNNIISMVEYFLYDKKHTYIVLELANKDLDKMLRDLKEPLSENQAKMYFFQISRAIDHLHRMGIAHRDIKLSNILMITLNNGKEVIKVADFGLSRVSYNSDYGTVMMEKPIGTIYYMSPQVLSLYVKHYKKPSRGGRGQRADPFKADIWALGVCLYRMFVREYPFDYSNEMRNANPIERERNAFLAQTIYNQQMRRNIAFPTDIGAKLTKECHNLLLDTLEVDKDKRIEMCSGIARNMWFDEWLDRGNAEEINEIDLEKFINEYQDLN